jgi:anaerobic magnesium-protoporphyrin IX monomethyl ester cyclase
VIAGIDMAGFTEADGSCKNLSQLNFEDDNLFADRDYAFEVIRYARKKLNGPAIIEENGIDSGFLDTELLDTLIDLGLNRLNLSLGSLDSRVLAKAGRNPGESRIAELTSHASGQGVESVTYFICGLPGDTEQTVAKNLLFLASLETKIGISLYYPVPGLQGFEDKTVFIDSPARLCCGSSAYPWTKTLPTTLLVTAFRLARFLNLIKESDKNQQHDELIRRTLREGRLYTWRKAGSGHEAVPVPHMAEDLVTEVITGFNVDTAKGHA